MPRIVVIASVTMVEAAIDGIEVAPHRRPGHIGDGANGMNVALRHRMSLADFLDWEERQELRYEFDGFRP